MDSLKPFVRYANKDWTRKECEELFYKICEGWYGFTENEANVLVIAQMGYMIEPKLFPEEKPYSKDGDGVGEVRNALFGLAQQCKKLAQEKYSAEHELRLMKYYHEQQIRKLEDDSDSLRKRLKDGN